MQFDTDIADLIGVREGDHGMCMHATAHIGDTISAYHEEFYVPMTSRWLSVFDHISSFAREY